MSLEQALSAPDPVAEIGARIAQKDPAQMTNPEKVFLSVLHFLDLTVSEGLERSMRGDSGEIVPLFVEFARRYGDQDLNDVAQRIMALLPPGDSSGRHRSEMAAEETDPRVLEELTEALCGEEETVRQALVALARRNAEQFDLR